MSWTAPTPPDDSPINYPMPQGIELFGGPCNGMVVSWSLGIDIQVITGWDRQHTMLTHIYEHHRTLPSGYIAVYKETR